MDCIKRKCLLVIDENGPIFGKKTWKNEYGDGEDVIIKDGIKVGKVYSLYTNSHIEKIARTDGAIDNHPSVASEWKREIVSCPN